MKKLIFMFAILIMIISCNKDNSGDIQNNSGIVIKGTIPVSQSKSLKVNSANSLSLSDATKVIVFSKYYSELYDIVNNTFSVTGQIETGVALIFLDANNDSWVIVQIDPIEYESVHLNNLLEFEQRKYGSTLLLFFINNSKLQNP